MENKTKVDQLHDMLPPHLNSRNNTNWNALVEALGGADQELVNLITEVKKQFFIKTAYRPYLDNLAANNNVTRPPGVGMDDPTFKKYIPILSYTPKQVKLIVDQLLNIFFAKETTTAFVQSGLAHPYDLDSGWELEYMVDEIHSELIHFNAADFTNINAATAQEIVSAINRQSQHSYADDYYDNVTKGFYVKIFSNTIGSKGSIRVKGGRANIPLQLSGFITTAGNGSNTQWDLDKVGDTITYEHIGGAVPQIDQLKVGDILISLLPGNVGSFSITSIDLGANKFTIKNLFGTAGTFTQTDATQTKFFRPNKYVVYTQTNRAVSWEVTPSEAIIEMPATPPVVKRSLIGAWHINGSTSNINTYNSLTSVTVDDASIFPMSGNFWIIPRHEIKTRWITPSENTLSSAFFNGRLQGTPIKYTYASRLALATTGNIVAGQDTITGLASVVGLAVGQSIFAQGIPSYAVITDITGFTVTMDFPAVETISNVMIQFAGNVLTGITPNLPDLAALNEEALSSVTRTSGVVTATTTTSHTYQVGDSVSIYGNSGIVGPTATGTTVSGTNQMTSVSPTTGIGPGLLIIGSGIPLGTTVISISGSTVTMSQSATTSATQSITFNENLNGAHTITSVTSNTFTYNLTGLDGSAAVFGTARVDGIGFSDSGSQVVITSALPTSFTRMNGSYFWDLAAPFVLSSNTALLVDSIQAGQVIPLLNVTPNTIHSGGGFIVFDYGLNTQEGPVRYLYTPNDSVIVLDPSYIFQHDHSVNSGVVSINHKGPHIMSGLGIEYPAYITSPADVRIILENLIRSVVSAGIFVNFLVRFPEQLYGTIPVYQIVSDIS